MLGPVQHAQQIYVKTRQSGHTSTALSDPHLQGLALHGGPIVLIDVSCLQGNVCMDAGQSTYMGRL